MEQTTDLTTTGLLDAFKGGQIKLENDIESYVYCGGIQGIGVSIVSGYPTLTVQLMWFAQREEEGWSLEPDLEYCLTLVPEMTRIEQPSPDRITIFSLVSNECVTLVTPGNELINVEDVDGLELPG